MGEKKRHQPIKQPLNHCTICQIVEDVKGTRRYCLSFEDTWQVMGFVKEEEELDG
jgi:negative regulator of sigma E activity